jgi:putative tryptophan/tyrosine transport system substrate-binding protein
MRRRDVIGVACGLAAAGLRHASAQQRALPVIGFVSSSNAAPNGAIQQAMMAFQQGLNESGFVERQNVAIEYRWAGGNYGRLPELVSDLIRRQVTLIVASGGLPTALSAKAATQTIPILFIAGFDPIKVGLVASLSHPGGNATGVSVYTTEMAQKRLEMLHNLVPKADKIAVLINPKSTDGAVPKIEIEAMEQAAHKFGAKLLVLGASTESDFDTAFADAVRQGAGALSVNGDPFFTPRRAKIVAAAARHRVPTIYPWREYVAEGGLMSYGPTLTWAYQRIGLYAGRILKGASPSDLPVQLPTTFQLVLNLKTARELDLTVPRIMLQAAEEIID